jgi:hypothetical protein
MCSGVAVGKRPAPADKECCSASSNRGVSCSYRTNPLPGLLEVTFCADSLLVTRTPNDQSGTSSSRGVPEMLVNSGNAYSVWRSKAWALRRVHASTDATTQSHRSYESHKACRTVVAAAAGEGGSHPCCPPLSYRARGRAGARALARQYRHALLAPSF